jgi:hypothetical protein
MSEAGDAPNSNAFLFPFRGWPNGDLIPKSTARRMLRPGIPGLPEEE